MNDGKIDLGLTHIALPVADVERSIEFYTRYAGMKVVHLAIVLIQTDAVSTILSPLAHLGVGCESRAAIDALCDLARQAGVLRQEPQDSGYPVGYWAFLSDPDGHTLELSYGQEIGLTVEDRHEAA
jgi:catechol 2,3-dioxygenase-like lactoylglutathione lyase family enzyme